MENTCTRNDTPFGSCLLSNCDQTPAMLLVILSQDTLVDLKKDIAAVIARMKAAKSEVMKRQMDLLKER